MYGANQSLCRLMIELRSEFNVKPIVLLSKRGELSEFLEQNEIQYYVSHFYWWVNADKGAFQKLLNYRKQIFNLVAVSGIVKLVTSEKIDLVYSNSITINMGILLSRKLRCPHIWHIRETMQAYDFKYSVCKFRVKNIFKKGADCYIVISDFLLNSYQDLLPINRTKRIYNGLSLNIENKNTNIYTTVLNIAIVGIICDQKNQLEALKALSILKAIGIINVNIHFIGGAKSDYLNMINNYVENYSLQDMVTFHGHQSNVNEILNDMNIGMVCARDEAFGRVSIEYMLHGMPVIASNSGANEELVKDGKNGFLYELNNAEELAERIEYFIRNPFMLESMGVFAKEYASRNFSSEQNTAEIYAVIEELLNSR